jgi:methylmalonyl-CoA carboxyltransferase large subunit
MRTESVDSTRVAEALEALRQEVARLSERVAALEAAVGPSTHTTPNAQATAAKPEAEGLSEEVLLVISAAIAAYLGKKAPIRQIRLLRSDAWAQQGRATIQASHAL